MCVCGGGGGGGGPPMSIPVLSTTSTMYLYLPSSSTVQLLSTDMNGCY